MTVEEFKSHPQQFDAALSISSFEHDGLGRYGDPLNPNGDLEVMSNMLSVIKDNGLFFLSVPVGQDTLVWNAQRIYGPLRLPKLLSYWKLLGIFPPMFPYTGIRDQLQPIFVLQNSRGNDIRLKRFIQKLIVVLACKRTVKFMINNLQHLRNHLP